MADGQTPKVTHKVTVGFVVQTYWDNKCVEQEFVAGNDVTYEDDYGETVEGPIDGEVNCPFEMRQPDEIEFSEE